MPTSLGPAEILVILVVALIVLGPKRLPEAGRQVGKAIAEVRKWSQTFQDEIKGVVDIDSTRPTYTQPQPGYDPAPIPVLPAETAPPPDSQTEVTEATAPPASPIPVIPAETAPLPDAGETAPPAPPVETNGAGVSTGSHGMIDAPAPDDYGPSHWADEPTYSDPAPTDPSGPTPEDPARP